MKKIVIFILAALISFIGFLFLMPKTTIDTNARYSFVIDKEFNSIRNSMINGKFEKELAKANDITMLEKTWLTSDLAISRPFSKKHREWEFNGTMNAKIRPNNNNYVDTPISLIQTLKISREE